MKYASEDLKNEHEAILVGLNILEKMAHQAKTSGHIDSKDIEQMVFFLRTFADKCHHGKEEGLLFPAMEKAGIPRQGGPIGAMLQEHVQGREFIAGIHGSVKDGEVDLPTFVKAAEGYAFLLRNHIKKENMILFPYGDKVLTPKVQDELIEAFENHEKTVMGEGIHEKLHEMLHAFEEKYLK